MDIDKDNLRIGTAKAVTHLLSFAQIICFALLAYSCTQYDATGADYYFNAADIRAMVKVKMVYNS